MSLKLIALLCMFVCAVNALSQYSLKGKGKCVYNNKQYKVGQKIKSDDGCNKCKCGSGGTVKCTKKDCTSNAGSCMYGGQRYKTGDKFQSYDGCNKCVCRSKGKVKCTKKKCAPQCLYEGKKYKLGANLKTPCKSCKCMKGGLMKCSIKVCQENCRNPKPIRGECCPKCDTVCTAEDGTTYSPGEDVPSSDSCMTCTCREDGAISCIGMLCRMNCENPVTVEGECCPVCEGCVDRKGNTYQEGEQMSGDKCSGCVCGKNHRTVCSATGCPMIFDCGGKEPATPVGQCCPMCPRDGQCSNNGVLYNDGDSFEDKCNKCHCINGLAACTRMLCPETQYEV